MLSSYAVNHHFLMSMSFHVNPRGHYAKWAPDGGVVRRNLVFMHFAATSNVIEFISMDTTGGYNVMEKPPPCERYGDTRKRIGSSSCQYLVLEQMPRHTWSQPNLVRRHGACSTCPSEWTIRSLQRGRVFRSFRANRPRFSRTGVSP